MKAISENLSERSENGKKYFRRRIPTALLETYQKGTQDQPRCPDERGKREQEKAWHQRVFCGLRFDMSGMTQLAGACPLKGESRTQSHQRWL